MKNGRRATISISKLDAAKRQLDLAIELWFMDRDEVAVHTLAAASYQVIHDLNEHLKTDHKNLFKPEIVKPNFFKKWHGLVRNPSNFFKHADKDPEGQMEFSLFATILYFIYSIAGLASLNIYSSDEERIFAMWLQLHEPDLVVEDSQMKKLLNANLAEEQLAALSALSKKHFFEVSKHALVNLPESKQA